MKRHVLVYVLLCLLTSQPFTQALQRTAHYQLLRRDARLDDEVTCHEDAVRSKTECATTCTSDAQCRTFAACKNAGGKSPRCDGMSHRAHEGNLCTYVWLSVD